jgi:hypothetical protein
VYADGTREQQWRVRSENANFDPMTVRFNVTGCAARRGTITMHVWPNVLPPIEPWAADGKGWYDDIARQVCEQESPL